MDIILWAGQSNTHQGYYTTANPQPATARSSPGNYQLGKDGIMKPLAEPVEHLAGWVNATTKGPAVSFADEYTARTGRNVLIIPCGLGGTGFTGGRWDVGGDLRTTLLARIKNLPVGLKVRGFVWQQGEADAVAEGHAAFLDKTALLFKDVQYAIGYKVPIVITGFTPGYASNTFLRLCINAKNILLGRGSIRYVSPTYPTVIQKVGDDDSVDLAHFEAAGMDVLGRRIANAMLGKQVRHSVPKPLHEYDVNHLPVGGTVSTHPSGVPCFTNPQVGQTVHQTGDYTLYAEALLEATGTPNIFRNAANTFNVWWHYTTDNLRTRNNGVTVSLSALSTVAPQSIKVVITKTPAGVNLYIDGVLIKGFPSSIPTDIVLSNARYSRAAVWNTALSEPVIHDLIRYGIKG